MVSIIILLEFVYRLDYPSYDVIVVDSSSKDDSIERIKKYCHGGIKVESVFFKYDPSNKPIEAFEISQNDAERAFNLQSYEEREVNRRAYSA